ncbi:uncharacterized protein LOC123549240 [Mercenaria mercenaria]|uniref:uncharacterized protein LOC123549240 n=1 Tax=Mercenaria mercenaria TaxID=6596 RepID=UPI00234EAD5B|nr:uncharacterized protein LOC123549240 [Mercenaria mercenaria]XP_053380790.1 uncharacterized protein LOC123549240 [Mercenaria mercenaria]
MSQADSVLESVTSIYSGFTEMVMSIKAVLSTVLEVNHNVMSVVLRLCVNFFSAVWAVLNFIFVIVYTLLVCVVDFLQELANFLTAFLYLLWKILILVYSLLDLAFHSLECLVYFLWTGGKWTAHTIKVSGQNLSDNGLSTWKYFVISLKEFTNSVVGGFSIIRDFIKFLAVFLYDSLCLSYEYAYEFVLYTDFYVRYVCRYCFETSYHFITEYVLSMPKEAYLGIVISCFVYIIMKNIIHHMCSEGFTFPVTGWFSSSITDELDSEYGDFEGDRGEFSDDEDGMNYTVSDYNEENNDQYSVNSEFSDASDDDDESSDSDGELEIDSDSDNESNAASESEMSEINIELPQPDGMFGSRRSTTPSRFTKDMSADDLKKVVDDEKEKRMCVVCQDRSKSVLILPCRHMCLCVDCGNQIARSRSRERRKCPLCRSKINTIMNVYV